MWFIRTPKPVGIVTTCELLSALNYWVNIKVRDDSGKKLSSAVLFRVSEKLFWFSLFNYMTTFHKNNMVGNIPSKGH